MIPKRHELYAESLKLLIDGKQLSTQELINRLVSSFNLSYQEQIQLGIGFTPLFNNRVAEAVKELGKAGLVFSPSRGIYSITANGYDILNENPVSISESHLKSIISEHQKTIEEKKVPPMEQMVSDESENFSIGAYELGESIRSNFEEFMTALKGRSSQDIK